MTHGQIRDTHLCLYIPSDRWSEYSGGERRTQGERGDREGGGDGGRWEEEKQEDGHGGR